MSEIHDNETFYTNYLLEKEFMTEWTEYFSIN